MALQSLPPELLAHILSYLPDLCPTPSPSTARTVTVGPNIPLTPPVCRASHSLRLEALPLYAKHSAFVIQAEDGGHRVRAWLDALDSSAENAVGRVRSLQLSQHWRLSQPTRWLGHVGFYVRLQWVDPASGSKGAQAAATGGATGEWRCTTGTYPIANDMRGMRLESVNLLQRVVEQRLRGPRLGKTNGGKGLTKSDVESVVQAMEVVAKHPIEAFDIEQSEQGRRARRRVWESMEKNLTRLGEVGRIDIGTDGGAEGETRRAQGSSRFFTPY